MVQAYQKGSRLPAHASLVAGPAASPPAHFTAQAKTAKKAGGFARPPKHTVISYKSKVVFESINKAALVLVAVLASALAALVRGARMQFTLLAYRASSSTCPMYKLITNGLPKY